MKAAILGLSGSGKSTLFSAISGRQITAAGAGVIEEAIVPVPDERLDWLTSLHKPKKTVQATIDCLDVPGFDFTAEHGRLVAGRLIDHIRTVDLIVLVVRTFEDLSLPAYRDRIDPVKDVEELKTELLLADLALVATRIEKLEKQLHKPTHTHSQDMAELELQKRLQAAIEAEKPISGAIKTKEELHIIKSLGFLTLKPMVVAVNVAEGQLEKKFDFANLEKDVPVINVCAKLDFELSQLDAQSRKDFMTELGITEPAAAKFVKACYAALGLISFLTIGSDEVRAWLIKQGTVALDAAGKVHSDIKRGFIKAEIFSYEDIKELGSEKALKAAGKIRLEGKEYIVRDGDIIDFKFNV
jgi:GTP-binding protein YchF